MLVSHLCRIIYVEVQGSIWGGVGQLKLSFHHQTRDSDYHGGWIHARRLPRFIKLETRTSFEYNTKLQKAELVRFLLLFSAEAYGVICLGWETAYRLTASSG